MVRVCLSQCSSSVHLSRHAAHLLSLPLNAPYVPLLPPHSRGAKQASSRALTAHPPRLCELCLPTALINRAASRLGRGRECADTSQKTDEATTPREGSASGGSGVKRARKSYRDRTFIHSDSQRKREFEKQMQILKDRSAALNASTGADVVLGVVNKEGHPVLWCTPNLHDFMVRTPPGLSP